MTSESGTKVTIRNVGNASGFMQLLVPEEHLIPSPSNFVLGPGQEQVVIIRLHPDRNFIGPLMGRIALICGTEVCRQVSHSLLQCKPKNIPASVQHLFADIFIDFSTKELKWTSALPFRYLNCLERGRRILRSELSSTEIFRAKRLWPMTSKLCKESSSSERNLFRLTIKINYVMLRRFDIMLRKKFKRTVLFP